MLAGEVVSQTTLTTKEAEVLAVRTLGYSKPEMASAIGGYEDEVEDHLASIRDQRLKVENQMDDLMRTAKLLDAM